MDKFNFCVDLILEFLWNFIQFYLLNYLKCLGIKSINIGSFPKFVSGQYVDFLGKVFLKGQYVGNVWAWVAHRYGAETFPIHIKSILQEKDINVM